MARHRLYVVIGYNDLTLHLVFWRHYTAKFFLTYQKTQELGGFKSLIQTCKVR